MYALNLDVDGRVLSATFEKYAAPGQPIVESLPEGNVSDYRYVEGEYVYDPLPEPEEPEQPVSLESRVETLEADSAEAKEALEMILSGVTS
jgi:hypothetical protein